MADFVYLEWKQIAIFCGGYRKYRQRKDKQFGSANLVSQIYSLFPYWEIISCLFTQKLKTACWSLYKGILLYSESDPTS